jgi:hemoglobin
MIRPTIPSALVLRKVPLTMTLTRSHSLSAALIAAFLGAAPLMAQAPAKSLYDRVGGEKAIRMVVDDFVALAAPDPKVDFTRGGKWQASDAAVKTLKDHLVNMLGSAFGGPQKYTGRTMKVAHQGMGITQAQFDAIAGHLKAALEKHKVGAGEIGEIMKIAASTAPDIVEKK